MGLAGSTTPDGAVEIATLALKCLSHLFTWVPLTTVISHRLLASVFHFAGLGIPAVIEKNVYFSQRFGSEFHWISCKPRKYVNIRITRDNVLDEVLYKVRFHIFIFQGGTAATAMAGSDNQSYNAYTNTQLSILAMGTINEIIYRHCVPIDFEDFLLQMFQNTFQLLQMLVQPTNTIQGTPPTAGVVTYQLQTLDES